MEKKRLNLKSFSLFFKAIANTKHEMWVSVQVLLAITVVLAVVLWAVEYSVQPDVYSNPLQTFIWASMQYIGDPGHFAEVSPVTFVGRIIAVLIGIIGIAIFAVPAGLIGSGFMDAIAEDRKEQKLNEASVVLHKRFRRSSQNNSWYLNEEGLKRTYKCVDRKWSLAGLKVRTGMSEDDIIATVNYCPDMRLSNLASTQRMAEKPQDRIVVETFPLNREYGCCVDRGSDVTIIVTKPQMGPGNFAFSLAAMGGFNYVSKEIEPYPDEPFGFFSMDKSELDIIRDYHHKEDVESQALHYMDDLRHLKQHSKAQGHRHWFVFLFGTSKSVECQVHLWRFATDKNKKMGHHIINEANNREYGSTVLGEDEKTLQSIFEDICYKLKVRKVTIKDEEVSIVSELDNTKRWKSVKDSNTMVRMGAGIDCNAFVIRIAYEIVLYHNAHLLIAKEIADAIKRQIEPDREIPESAKKCYLQDGDGFADDYGKEEVFMRSPQALKKMIEAGRKYALEKFEHLDLDGKEQEDYAEHHQTPWYKKIIK